MNQQTDPARRLDALLEKLPQAIEPERDMWPRISAAIAEHPHPSTVRSTTRRRSRVLGSLAVVLAASIAGVVVLVLSGGPVALRSGSWTPATRPDITTRAGRFSGVRHELELRYKERLELLDPAVRARVEADLETIRAAQADLEKALNDDPSNPVLRHLQTNSTLQELELYSNITRATELVASRNRT
jgi:hypothetical protein